MGELPIAGMRLAPPKLVSQEVFEKGRQDEGRKKGEDRRDNVGFGTMGSVIPSSSRTCKCAVTSLQRPVVNCCNRRMLKSGEIIVWNKNLNSLHHFLLKIVSRMPLFTAGTHLR